MWDGGDAVPTQYLKLRLHASVQAIAKATHNPKATYHGPVACTMHGAQAPYWRCGRCCAAAPLPRRLSTVTNMSVSAARMIRVGSPTSRILPLCVRAYGLTSHASMSAPTVSSNRLQRDSLRRFACHSKPRRATTHAAGPGPVVGETRMSGRRSGCIRDAYFSAAGSHVPRKTHWLSWSVIRLGSPLGLPLRCLV